MTLERDGNLERDENLKRLADRSEGHQAFVCILKDYAKLEAILLACVEHDISGGTILDGRGMGQVLCQDIPVFLHLRDHFPEAEGDSYVLLIVATDRELDLCFELAERICGPSAQGVVFALPILRFKRFSPIHSYFSSSISEEVEEESEQTPQG